MNGHLIVINGNQIVIDGRDSQRCVAEILKEVVAICLTKGMAEISKKFHKGVLGLGQNGLFYVKTGGCPFH